ncbi:MAG TPA: alpha/beta fold hydrolase [Candidatus Krumholzibacteria bacterium]
MRTLVLTLLVCLVAFPMAHAAEPASFAGDWVGALDVGGQKLHLVFHLLQSGAAWSGTIDSVDQGANGIPIGTVTVDGAKLHLDLPAIKGTYDGTLSGDGAKITGTWAQGGASLPLELARGDASTIKGPNRPQEPKPPLPYDSEEVSYPNPRANITLAGTFTKPKGAGPFPVALLITGSGPQDRDESVMSHKPFLVLADYLTRNGIAVLRVDDRGIGKSTGTFEGSTSGDFADDVLAGIDYLKSRKDVDASRIGLVGHSEGGIIAPMVAAKSKDVAFIVMLAGVGVPADELLMRQSALIMKANGASDAMAKDNQEAQKKMFEIVRAEKDPAAAEPKLRAVGDALLASLTAADPTMATAGKASIDGSVKMVNSPWFRYWLSLDPAATLRQVKQPVLALNGSLDLQVDPKQNLPAIEKALKDGGNTDATVTELAGLNHLFQTATTGAPGEYATIEETMSPVAMKTVADWIVARTGAKKK